MSEPTTRITDEAVAEVAGRMFDGDLVRQPQRVQDSVWRDARAALEAALPYLTPQVDREALARAAHHYFCLSRSESNHDPVRSDYDKADEILEILALIEGSRDPQA